MEVYLKQKKKKQIDVSIHLLYNIYSIIARVKYTTERCVCIFIEYNEFETILLSRVSLERIQCISQGLLSTCSTAVRALNI